MDDKKTLSKGQKLTTMLMPITVSLLLLTNASFVFTREDKYSGFMPLSIALCAASVILAVICLFSVVRNYKELTERKRSVIGCVGIFILCGLEIWMSVSAVMDMNAERNAENSAVLFIKDKYGIDAAAEYHYAFFGFRQ